MASVPQHDPSETRTCEDSLSIVEDRIEMWTAAGIGVGAVVGAPFGSIALGLILGASVGFFVGHIAAIAASEREIYCYS